MGEGRGASTDPSHTCPGAWGLRGLHSSGPTQEPRGHPAHPSGTGQAWAQAMGGGQAPSPLRQDEEVSMQILTDHRQRLSSHPETDANSHQEEDSSRRQGERQKFGARVSHMHPGSGVRPRLLGGVTAAPLRVSHPQPPSPGCLPSFQPSRLFKASCQRSWRPVQPAFLFQPHRHKDGLSVALAQPCCPTGWGRKRGWGSKGGSGW